MTQSLIEVVEGLGQPRLLVVGDLILDRYIWGDAERISQEAPVILLRADQREERLGGAASVSMMLAALESHVTLAGVLGNDDTGRCCRGLLDQLGVDHSLVLNDPSRPSTLKERYMGRAQQKHPQQMLRVDYEVRDALSHDLGTKLAASILARLDDFDIVLISDYDKGVCTPTVTGTIIDACRQRHKKVLVDPIRGAGSVHQERYHGCSTMTPNRLEAGLASGTTIRRLADAAIAGRTLVEMLDLEVGLITLDKEGMLLVDRNGVDHHFGCRPRQVYDITGAGDMVLAVLGMTLAAGHDYPEAIALANIAGGLEVERIGVAPVRRDEIILDLLQHRSDPHAKLIEVDHLTSRLRQHRQAGQRIVFTNGCFDLLHVGHIQYLQEAKQQGDVLIVGLNADASVRRLKGPSRPMNPEQERAGVLSALACVDYVCLFSDDTPLNLIRHVRPDVLVKGSDYQLRDVVGADFVASYGGRVHLAEFVPGRSTTRMIQQAQPKEAA